MERKLIVELNFYQKLIVSQKQIISNCTSRWNDFYSANNNLQYYKLYLIPEFHKQHTLMDIFDIECYVGSEEEYETIHKLRITIELLESMYVSQLYMHSLSTKINILTEEQRFIAISKLMFFGSVLQSNLVCAIPETVRLFQENNISEKIDTLANRLMDLTNSTILN